MEKDITPGSEADENRTAAELPKMEIPEDLLQAAVASDGEGQAEEILFGDDPVMRQKAADGMAGRFDHTILELWHNFLSDELMGYSSPPTMDTYEAFLRSWPWIGYHDVESIRKMLLEFTKQSMDVMDEGIRSALQAEATRNSGLSRSLNEVFADPEDDWLKNKHIYTEVIAHWTALVWTWGPQWAAAGRHEQPKLHVATHIAINRLIGQNGLHAHPRQLEAFEFTKEDQNAMTKRVEQLTGAVLDLPDEEGDDV